jgi:hypothetical protein
MLPDDGERESVCVCVCERRGFERSMWGEPVRAHE